MDRTDTSRSFGRFGIRTLTGAGIGTALAAAAFISMRGGFFTRGAAAEFVAPAVAFDALEDGFIDVPTEARSIQAAFDFAPDGATVRIAPGTYAGATHCSGKSITVIGSGEGSTVVRGFGRAPVMTFTGESSNRVELRGISFVGGRGESGSGLVLDGVAFDVRDSRFAGNTGSGAVVRGGSGDFGNCTFDGNRSPRSGGALSNEGGRVEFIGCSFRHNVSATFGGAVFSKGGRVELLACSLEDNATHSGAWGGAVFGEDAAVELHGSEFARNRSIESGGAVYLMGGTADITKCSFSGNFSDEARSVFSRGAGVRIATSHLCGVESVAVGGDFSFGDGNVFDPSCFGDCNQNGVSDAEEIELGWSPDRDGNGTLDACDPDCNSNGLPDGYEIAGGFAQDLNANGMIDICEIRAGLALDVDNDWIPDDAQAPAMDAMQPAAGTGGGSPASTMGAVPPPLPAGAPAGPVPDPFDPWAGRGLGVGSRTW